MDEFPKSTGRQRLPLEVLRTAVNRERDAVERLHLCLLFAIVAGDVPRTGVERDCDLMRFLRRRPRDHAISRRGGKGEQIIIRRIGLQASCEMGAVELGRIGLRGQVGRLRRLRSGRQSMARAAASGVDARREAIGNNLPWRKVVRDLHVVGQLRDGSCLIGMALTSRATRTSF